MAVHQIYSSVNNKSANSKIFYCYISHQKKVYEDIESIEKAMSSLSLDNYYIFYGGSKKINIQNNKAIHIDCDDTYEGLPNKVHSLCKYISNSQDLIKYNYFCKIDSTNPLKKHVPVIPRDYYGYIGWEDKVKTTVIFNSGSRSVKGGDINADGNGDRKYHIGKCSKNSEWNKKPYEGKFIPYCYGPCYVLSRKCIDIVAKSPNDPNRDILEDLYVAQQLIKSNIYPYHIPAYDYI